MENLRCPCNELNLDYIFRCLQCDNNNTTSLLHTECNRCLVTGIIWLRCTQCQTAPPLNLLWLEWYRLSAKLDGLYQRYENEIREAEQDYGNNNATRDERAEFIEFLNLKFQLSIEPLEIIIALLENLRNNVHVHMCIQKK